jgi:hypothetical protein
MIEAAWGLGEGVVQVLVNPDNYIIRSKDCEVLQGHVSCKEVMVVRKSEREAPRRCRCPRISGKLRFFPSRRERTGGACGKSGKILRQTAGS